MKSLHGLNPQQAKAVSIVDKHLLVVAGAGSGKTRVLTHKIAHLVEDHGVHPNQILAMTFSNRAANEMVDRVQKLLPSFERPRWMGTFHSLCLRLLKEFHTQAELPSQFTIYDESDQLSAMKRALEAVNLDPKYFPPSNILNHLDRAKNETFRVLEYLENKTQLTEGGFNAAKKYQEILKQNHALDFGDLIARMVKLLKENKEVREMLQERFARILVDEYQDTNRIQKELLKELSGQGIVCAVGDEDQSIYGWRGARVENILEFEDDFTGAEIVKLEQNYRSTQKILNIANIVISKNIGRRDKNLWTENEEGAPVSFMLEENDYNEAAFVLDEIQKATRTGKYEPSQIAIFYRTHVQSRVLEEEFRRRNLTYRIFGGVRFYDRQEIKNTLAFLRLALNTADNISFQRIVNVPSRGIGDKTIERLSSVANERTCSLLDAIPFIEGSGKAEKALRDFHTWFTTFAFDAAKMQPEKAAELVLDQSGYRKVLEQEGSIESDSRLENIDELLRSMEEFSENTEGKLTDYMDQISLVTDMDTYNQENSSVVMMTVHNSKGLEFDLVFMVGMEEGIFPHKRSIDDGDPNELEEERRLCYVAMTRAKKQLFMSAARERRVYQSTVNNPVSRFIAEIPTQHLLHLNDEKPTHYDGMQISSYSAWGKYGTKFSKPKPKFDEYKQESYDDFEEKNSRAIWGKAAAAAQQNLPYPPGTRVVHPEFGMGTVKRCEGPQTNLKLTIQFQRGGLKKLSLNFCSLEKVDG